MNWKRFFVVVVALLAAFSLSTWRTAAQTSTTGDVAGVVTDPTNAVVPDAKVTLKDNAKGSSQESKTNKEGAFRFYLLAPGSYTLTVSATGFQAVSRPAQVAVGQIVTVDVQVALGSSTQTVTVTETAPLIQTENGDTASSINQQQVANVPNPGNDLSAIAQLAPGIVINSQGGFGNVEAFGLPATSNLFTMNGMDDNDPFLNLNNSGASNLLLGSNEVQEADVVTNAYSGSFGSFSGIQVNYITKSGSNEYHGNAVYYWNGRTLNANDWFNKDQTPAQPRAFDNANQWAASFGGPIKKDKFFFFLNTEGLRVLIPVPSQIIVPSQAFESAIVQNLTALGDTASIPYYCQNLAGICPGVTALNAKDGIGMFNILNGTKNYANAQNSLIGGGCDNVGPGVGSGAIFNTFGAGNPCMLSLRETPVNFAPEKQIAGRADWNIGPNDRAYLRMQYDQGVQPTFTDPINPVFNSHSDQPEYQGQLTETHTFNPTFTNQFEVSATWYSAIFKSPDESAFLATFPGVLTTNDGSFPLLGGINFVFPQGRNVTQFQVNDDLSKTIGNHTLHFGAKLHRNYVSDHDNGVDTVPFSIPLTLADYVNAGDAAAPGSIGTVFVQNFPQSQNLPIRLYEVGGYVQDDWRIRPNFTISPALRIEHESNPLCVSLCFGQFAAPLSTIEGEPNAPYNQELQINRRNALLGFQDVQWEPRISFAWQPFGSASSWWKRDFVVRGGAGIFYDIFPGQIADAMSVNPPLVNSFTILSASIAPPGQQFCPGFLAPNQNPGENLFDCAVAANAGFNQVFTSGGNSTPFVPNVTFTPSKNFAPQIQKWSLEIQKGLGRNSSIDIGYFGNHVIHLPVLDTTINAFGIVSQLPATPAQPQYGNLQEVASAGVSNYNGIVVSYKHRISGSFGSGVLQFNYTYGHALDEVSNGGFNPFVDNSAGVGAATSISHPQEGLANLRNAYGNADYDVRHSLNANYVWELPIRKALGGRGWAPLVDGWQVSGNVFFRTGFPFTVIDDSLLGVNNYGISGQFGPYVLPNPTAPISSFTCNSEQHFGVSGLTNPCAFAAGFPTVNANVGGVPGSEGTFGADGLRNLFRGPHYFDTDFSFTKKTKIPHWERGELQLGLQFFNIFNHPNFNLPSNSVSNPFFGTVQSTVNPPTSILGSFLGGDASPRLIQIKAQLVF